MKDNMIKKQCPCCDYFTLDSRNDYEICPICFWEDDGLEINNLDEISLPNRITLKQWRENFLTYWACDKEMIDNVLKENQRKKYNYEKR